jgi:hypothetical protein
MMKWKLVNDLYHFQGLAIINSTCVSSMIDSNIASTQLSHTWLRHINGKGMIELSKQDLLCGLKIDKLDFSEHCIYGKICKVKFSTTIHCTKGIVDYVYFDLWGSSPIISKVVA